MKHGKTRGRMPGSGIVPWHHAGDGMGRHPGKFAYTAEQWASLRDNQLEFTEIAEFSIHVYNNTVIQNQLEYEDFPGPRTRTISRMITMMPPMIYTEAWNILIRRIQIMPAAFPPDLSSQIQADNLREQGDDMWRTGTSKGWNMTRQRQVW